MTNIGALKRRLRDLESEVSVLDAEIAAKQAQAVAARRELEQVRSKIASMSRADIVVTDHAVVRYMERRLGMDINSIRNEMVSPELRAAVASLGNCTFNGLVVKDHVIVTYKN